MRRQAGFTLIELMITMAIIAVLAAIAIPMYREVLLRAHINAAALEANTIYKAIKSYQVDNSVYPDAAVDTFEPLVSMGYYDGRLLARVVNNEADGFESPDDLGTNQEFWLEFTLAADPTVRFLVSDSDDAPLGGGDYLDGIFLYRNGAFTPL